MAGELQARITRHVGILVRHVRLLGVYILATWVLRCFDVAVYIYLAAVFPNSLLPSAIYGAAQALSGLVFFVPLGRWIDGVRRLKGKTNSTDCQFF